MRFEGEKFETATVKFTLRAVDRGVIQEEPAIPVKCLFDVSYVMNLSLQRYGKQVAFETEEYNQQIQRMKKENTDGKKDETTTR